ncbi:MAG: hypothetical protein NTZ09_15440 [Candidatus Hydrogenedentes bacterium]|nr:hypothetical protein [Candidatus Hydrogenedentota bacterium]
MSTSKGLVAAVGLLAVVCLGAGAPSPAAAEQFDISPFALPNTPPNEIWFEEPRDILTVVAEFEGNVPDNIQVSYQYHEKSWPKTRIEEAAKGHPGGFGWVRQPDWFNGSWRRAAVRVEPANGRRAVISFQNLKAEFDDNELGDYDVAFRRTYAVRVEGPGNPRIVGIYTTSAPMTTDLKVQLDAGSETPATRVKLSGYNSLVGAVNRTDASVEGIEVGFTNERPRQFSVSVQHMKPAHPYSGDDGHILFSLDADAFTISLPSIEEQGPIWFPDMGVYITLAGDPTSFEQYRDRCASLKTIRQQVVERPEQSLAGSHNGQPRPHLCNYNLGCTHACQRFWLESNGDVVLHKRNVTWLPGKGAERYKNKGDAARFYFGLENWRILARYPDPEPILAYNVLARQGGLTVEQKSIAVPLLTSISTGTWQGDDPMVALIRFRFHNDGAMPAVAELPVRYSQSAGRNGGSHGDGIPRGPLDELTVKENKILSAWKDELVTRCEIQTDMTIEARGNEAALTKEIQPGESCEAVLKIPYVSPEGPQELDALTRLAFEPCYAGVTEYWRRVATRGAFLETPEPQLGALHTAHLAHILLSDYAMPDGLVNTSVGTSTYGNYSNESCMIVNELDQRGLHDEAQRRLDLWIKYQGTAKQPGNFTDYNGMYFGAGGYECGSYNQHHGWVLWCLAEHFLLTHDTAWFNRSADSIIAGADWVFRQRKNTMTDLPHSRGWERGFLPAGSLEDVTDFYYWLSTNSLTWRGAEYAARALEAAQHPEAARIRQEADAYKQDLIRGFETMRQHTPLVRLRDGRWVPDYPSRLYRRGREVGWIREVLEGSVYLLISGLYDASSKQAQWILDDFQDNRYMNPPYGYSVPDFDMTWYDRGGISMQPNLLAGLMPYLMRDEPEMYIWMFYNAWNSCYIEEANAMVEHPLPVLGWSNHVLVKTSDEANAVTWLRYMFVYPREGTLHLGKAIPRAWFAQPEPFKADNVATPFGNVSVTYEPNPKANTCKATVTFDPTQPPQQLLLRFRTPNKTPLKTITINGVDATPVDANRGDVDITGCKGTTTVEVGF